VQKIKDAEIVLLCFQEDYQLVYVISINPNLFATLGKDLNDLCTLLVNSS
jgi:hypothetical protein